MTIERAVLLTVWLVCLILIPITIPRARIREAVLVFLASQAITWTLSILFVEMGLLENPVREFPAATGTNFTNNYVLYPYLSTIFFLYYPLGKSLLRRICSQAVHLAIACIYVYAIKTYTDIVNYLHYNMFLTGIVFFLGMNVTRWYGYWFFKKA
ncbi:CBO0543 family protein [Paenibacillus sp. SI8]|uniref:CBO0543 family protein n=1 Tax=unclassified Paenibacillus TaxID=185978 RepID=UPI0034678BC3